MQAESRAEFAERSLTKLERTIDDLEGETGKRNEWYRHRCDGWTYWLLESCIDWKAWRHHLFVHLQRLWLQPKRRTKRFMPPWIRPCRISTPSEPPPPLPLDRWTSWPLWHLLSLLPLLLLSHSFSHPLSLIQSVALIFSYCLDLLLTPALPTEPTLPPTEPTLPPTVPTPPLPPVLGGRVQTRSGRVKGMFPSLN